MVEATARINDLELEELLQDIATPFGADSSWHANTRSQELRMGARPL